MEDSFIREHIEGNLSLTSAHVFRPHVFLSVHGGGGWLHFVLVETM